jgi:hypothetical protein
VPRSKNGGQTGRSRFFPTRQQPQRNPQARCDICPCARPPIRSIIVPAGEVDAAVPAKDARGQKSARKSHAFNILTYKIFVMKILRGISPVEVGKLLILDIL